MLMLTGLRFLAPKCIGNRGGNQQRNVSHIRGNAFLQVGRFRLFQNRRGGVGRKFENKIIIIFIDPAGFERGLLESTSFF